MPVRLTLSLALAALAGATAAAVAPGATLHPVGSFDQPVFVTSDPTDPERLFVVERPGRVTEVEGGSRRLYADLSELVSCCFSERGLLSIALPADFEGDGMFYAAYTGTGTAGGEEGDVHVDAFTPTGEEDGEVSRQPILSIEHSTEGAHNGGQLQFGPDGYLYISVGDGGGVGDPFENAQDRDTLLGTILRIDPQPGSVPSYLIPPGNPFASGAGADEIWSYGLRNPWRFSFDRLTGDMLVGDVGQAFREEVDLASSPAPGAVGGAGVNYGWSCREGSLAYTDSTPAENCAGAEGFTDPLFDYPHDNPGHEQAFGCAIIGGYVARDPGVPDLLGRYVYADHCTHQIRSLALPAGGRPPADRPEGLRTDGSPNSFGEDSAGRLYLAASNDLYRFGPGSPPGPGEEPDDSEEREPSPPPGDSDPKPRPSKARVLISASRHGAAVQVAVRVTPCASLGGGRLQLKKRGRIVATRRLGRDCTARFRLRLPKATTLLAVFRGQKGWTIRSRHLVIRPPSITG